MKLIEHSFGAAALAAAALLGFAVQAQPMQMQMPMAAGSKAMTVEPTEGEVRKVDKVARKITLRHGEIRNLGMAPMAMQFDVKDRALIDKLKVGDKVRFKAVYESGKYVVTEIKPAK